MKLNYLVFLLVWQVFTSFPSQASEALTLEQAIVFAQQNDPWLHNSQLQQSALEQKSLAAKVLPNPKLTVGMLNLPTNTLHFGQENMSQFNLGVSQAFARGDSLAIKQQQLGLAANKLPFLRADRQARVQQHVSELWLDAFLAQQSIKLIAQNRALFEQMADVAAASYANVIGKTLQQDVISAQVELLQLEDRLLVENQRLDRAMAGLSQWLQGYDANTLSDESYQFSPATKHFSVADNLPTVALHSEAILNAKHNSRTKLVEWLTRHPATLAFDVQQQVMQKSVDLAKQQYQPQWSVNASYGYRGESPLGESRADLFSVGVSVDIPLFNNSSVDHQVSAAVAESQGIKTEKLLHIKQMLSALENQLKQYQQLIKRQAIYQQQLLKQTHDRAEAALTAYTNDELGFSEVVAARVTELNTQIATLKIDVDLLKTVVRINYYFAGENRLANSQNSYGER